MASGKCDFWTNLLTKAYFAQALDMQALRAQFDLPATIVLTKDTVHDKGNFVRITQMFGPQPVLSFGA